MKKTIDLTKTGLSYEYEMENEWYGGMYLELDGNEETVADLYDWLINLEMENMKDFGYKDMKRAEYEKDTILFQKANEEGEWEKEWLTIKIYAAIEDEDGNTKEVYIPYSGYPISAVKI